MKRDKDPFFRGVIITVLVFAVLLGCGYGLIRTIAERTDSAETEIVRSAVRSAVLTCYAVEGMYPSELDYLKTHYGLIYDEEKYMVIYDAFASNIIPDVEVLVKGAAQ